ncbi:MAG: hypothetical protein KAR44_11570 [Candidatus Aegiribacteria sp.]|nr:hypothetical protein [Candidatus Aegiribacteria sp.]
MCTKIIRILVGSILIQSSWATPPDAMTTDIDMIAGSPEKAVFLVRTVFNHGSHYLWETRWFLLCMDLTDFSFQWESQGSMMEAEEEFGGISFSRVDGAPSIAGVLEDWGVLWSINNNGDSYFTISESKPEYFIRDSVLLARRNDEEYAFISARCFDPVNLAVLNTDSAEWYITADTPVIVEIHSLNELARLSFRDKDSLAITVHSDGEFENYYLLTATVEVDMAPYDVIFTIPLEDMRAARSFLFDQM